MSEPDLRVEEDEERDLLERLESEEYSVEELLDDDRLRRMLVRAVVRYDIDGHRGLYDRLAKS